MLFGNSNELEELVDGLLERTEKEVRAQLESEDERMLAYANRTMIQKMPKELQLQTTHKPTLPREVNTPTAFPSMFEAADRRTYEYIKENIDDMKRIATNYSHASLPRRPSSRAVDIVQEREQHQPPEEEKSFGSPPTPTLIEMPKSQKDGASVHSMRSMSSQSVGKQVSPGRNPFVANSINFTDKHANSKALAQKYPHLSFSENSRNMTALAQTAKYQAFSHSVAFPTTVLAGTLLPPSDNTFSRETKLNVDDVMRYTLGVKRERSDKAMASENPFVRVPRRRE